MPVLRARCRVALLASNADGSLVLPLSFLVSTRNRMPGWVLKVRVRRTGTQQPKQARADLHCIYAEAEACRH